MGFKSANPGCNCCCTFASDSFSSGSSPSSATWNQDAGTWTVAGGTLQTTSATAALKCKTANASGASARIQVDLSASASGDSLRLMFDYQDQNNYKYAEFVFSTTDASKLGKIGQRVAGTDTVEVTYTAGAGELTPGGGATTVTCCFDTSTNKLSINTANQLGSYTFGSNNGNAYVGLGTGSLSGTASFDNFTASQFKTGCPTCFVGCDYGSPTPPRLKLVMSGWTQSPDFPYAVDVYFPDCSDCDAIFGLTVYLNFTGSYAFDGWGCAWVSDPVELTCVDSSESDTGNWMQFVAVKSASDGKWYLCTAWSSGADSGYQLGAVCYPAFSAGAFGGLLTTQANGQWDAEISSITDLIGDTWTMNVMPTCAGNDFSYICVPPSTVQLTALAS